MSASEVLPEIEDEVTVFTVSDSSGETANAVARAAAVQFKAKIASVYHLPRLKSVDQVGPMMQKIASRPSIIAYTLVLPELKEAVENEAALRNVPVIDLLGPLIEAISLRTGRTSISEPGRLHLLDESYFRRIAALDFAIKFDDGKNPDGILQAEVVLVGVSRTSKTPNSVYLAHHYGLKCANAPLIPNVEPPVQLSQIENFKIIGLDIDPPVLQDIRIARSRILGMSFGAYVDAGHIEQEVEYARKMFGRLRCHVINVSSKAIEETSSEIFLHLRNNKE